MKSTFFIITISFGLIFAACKSEENKTPEITQQKSLNDFMIGKWETQYIKIEYNTFQKADSSYIFEDDFSTPNSGKAQSEYLNNGTFSAWFKQSDNTKVGVTSGKWKTNGNDSLYVDYLYLGKQVQVWYTIEQKENQFKGIVTYDWDNDGEKDDKLIMKSKRIQ
ncbi:hypothetical protein ACSIGC_11680 [Tenacibaculum sp. ZS6-P6]|uniref:hypothetical protein n=1 Tax=Tenacibaculum sp. ZS6-P6 TaxID=3447503 RepID=UPI003F998CAC